MGLGASSPAGPSVSWLASSSPVSTSSLTALEPGYPVWDPVWVGGKGPGWGPAGTWVVGGAPFRLASDFMVSTNLDFGKRHGDPRPLRLQTRLGCAPKRNFGSKSRRCPVGRVGGEAPGGS